MDDTQEKKLVKRGKRSPGYPLISLEEAVQRAKILWDKDKNSPTPILAAYEHLGYKTIGGYGGRVLSALKQFGLIYEKQGDIILTNEAVDLALHEPHDNIYIETVKKLSIKPNIYEKLFNEYSDGLPSDATLKVKLIKEYEFNPDKVNGFIADFRRTIEYAKLLNEKKEALEKEKEGNKNLMENIGLLGGQNKTKVDSKMQKIQSFTDNEREIAHYPIGKGLKARILVSGASPVTGDTIKKLIGLLELNKDDLPEIADFNLDDKNETSEQ
jgi:hypothetical protein